MDPTTELSLALHDAPGVYAVLLGSGVSRDAEIPTGWEVTVDLITRLAAAAMGEVPADPAGWYHETYSEDPDYSEVLEKLAPTAAERQAILRGYFEPTADEREQGVKQPTRAHHAVADLAARGIVRIVLTTNFDTLTEQALVGAGVAHDVWSSPDAIRGGVPLTHGRVIVLKLHGDYRDTRLLNTLTELEAYDPAIDALLDRILDEFGLVVCGWSGVWDAALREAILRAPNRRYRTFWAARHGRVADEAKPLVAHREAVVVPIEDAASFFAAVADKVAILGEVARPHPASVDLAVAAVKRYLPDERDRIRLTDTVMEEARRLRDRTHEQERYPVSNVSVDGAKDIVHRYEADTETLLHVLATLGAHGDSERHRQLAVRALEFIVSHDGDRSGLTALLALRRYPALLCFYALGLGAVSSSNWQMVRDAALEPRWRDGNEAERLVTALHPFRVFEDAAGLAQWLATGEREPANKRHTPHSDYLHDILRVPLRDYLDSDRRYDEAFDQFEYLAGALVADLREHPAEEGAAWIPTPYVGRLRWRHQHAQRDPISSSANSRKSELACLVGDDARWEAARASYAELIAQSRKGML